MQRRTFMAGAAAGALAAPAIAQTPARMVVGAYGGSYEKIMREEVLPAFEQANNVRVDYLAGNSTDTLARMQAQRGRQEISVAVLDDGPMYQAISLGFAAPATDTAAMNALYPIARLGGGRALGIGFVSTGIGYNTRIFQERGLPVPESWNDLARPEFRRRLSIPGIDNTYGLHTLVMMARLNGGSEASIDPGFTAMRTQINPNVLAYESSPGKMSELFQSGEIWLAVWGSGRIQALRQSGFPVAFVNPKEGGVVLMTAGCVVEGGPLPELSQKLLAHLTLPGVQRSFALQYGYGPTNRSVELPPDQTVGLIYGEDAVRGLIAVDWEVINRNRQDWTRRWQREVER